MQADSFIKERLSKNSQIMLDNEVRAFALVGLRTLLIAMRLISEY